MFVVPFKTIFEAIHI